MGNMQTLNVFIIFFSWYYKHIVHFSFKNIRIKSFNYYCSILCIVFVYTFIVLKFIKKKSYFNLTLLKLLSNNMHENNQNLLYKDEKYVQIPYAFFFGGNRILFASMLEKKSFLPSEYVQKFCYFSDSENFLKENRVKCKNGCIGTHIYYFVKRITLF